MFAFLEAVNDTDNDFFHLDEETRPDQQKTKTKAMKTTMTPAIPESVTVKTL